MKYGVNCKRFRGVCLTKSSLRAWAGGQIQFLGTQRGKHQAVAAVVLLLGLEQMTWRRG